MALKNWHHAVMREDFLSFTKGEKVFMIQSTIKYSNPSLNPSFWLMNPKEGTRHQVAEAEFGNQLYKLVKVGPEVTESQGDKLTSRAKVLLADSVYSPKGQALCAKYADALIKHKQAHQGVVA